MRFAGWQWVFYATLFVLLVWLTPRIGFDGDLEYWTDWATYSARHGLGNVYQLRRNDYPPLYHYVLFAYGRLLAGNAAAIIRHRHELRAFTLLFDFAGALAAVSLVGGQRRRFALSLLLLLNVAYLYDTLLWEQVDAIYVCLSFLAVLLALRRRLAGSVLCYVLALNMKLQAIIFLPPLLLLWLPLVGARRLVGAVGVAGLGQLALVAPFIWGGDQNYLPRILLLTRSAGDRFPFLSSSAFNGWFLLFWQPSLRTISDTLGFAGVTYKHWGLLLFSGASAVVLWPLLRLTLRLVPGRRFVQPQHYALVLLSCGLLPIVFCYFNTQMHQRYWHGALLFLAAYGFLTRDYWPFALTCMAYLLNLEPALQVLRLADYQRLPFNPQFVAGLFTLLLLLGGWRLYRLAARLQNGAAQLADLPAAAAR